MRHVVISSLAAVQLTPARENGPGQRPGGEAHNVYDAGGRYTSLIGSTRYFHHPDDHWPYAMDTEHIVRLTQAYIQVAAWLANS